MTLPKEIRLTLEIEDGDRVLLMVEPDGKVVLEKALIVSASKRINNAASLDRKMEKPVLAAKS
jgi:AbrB family looped-hinge helix DNA binding protein